MCRIHPKKHNMDSTDHTNHVDSFLVSASTVCTAGSGGGAPFRWSLSRSLQ